MSKNKYKHIKTFESFYGELLHKVDYGDLEYLSKPKYYDEIEVDPVTKAKILDVNNFETWLRNDCMSFGKKGAPHLVGKIHILTPSLIEDYFFDQGVQGTDEEIFDFIDKIKSEWLVKYSHLYRYRAPFEKKL